MSAKKKSPADNWDNEMQSVGGLDTQINEIRERIFIPRMLNKELMRNCNLTAPRGAVLYGLPGTGKTLLVRTLCKSLNIPDPKVVNGPEIFGKFIGDSEAAVRAIFEPAKKCTSMYVVIIDEIDSMCRARSNSGGGTVDATRDSVVCQFLACIDGFHVNDNVVIFATTNRKDLLDPAILRPGRLEVHIEIPVPDETARHKILEVHTRSIVENSLLDKNVNLKQLATQTVGFSGADLKALVNRACVLAIRTSEQFKKSGYNNLVKMKKINIDKEHFNEALKNITPSNSTPNNPSNNSSSSQSTAATTSAKEQNHTLSKKIDVISETLKNLSTKHDKLQTKYKALREEMTTKGSHNKAKIVKKKNSKGSSQPDSSDESSSESETDNSDSESDESSEESDSDSNESDSETDADKKISNRKKTKSPFNKHHP